MAVDEPPTLGTPYRDELPELIGRVTIAYNEVQFIWSLLFSHFLWGDRGLAKGMFNAIRNDATQRDVIAAAAEVTLSHHPAVLSESRRLMKRTNELVAERNAAIHTFWDRNLVTGAYMPTPSLPKHGKLRDDPVEQFAALRDELGEVRTELLTLMTWTAVKLASHDRFQTRLPPPFDKQEE